MDEPTRADAAAAIATLVVRRRQVLEQVRRPQPRWRLPAEMATAFAAHAVKDVTEQPRLRRLRAGLIAVEIATALPAERERVRVTIDPAATSGGVALASALPLGLLNALGRRWLAARIARSGVRRPGSVAGTVIALVFVPLGATTARRVQRAVDRVRVVPDATTAPAASDATARLDPLLADRTALSIAGLLGACESAERRFARDAVAAGDAAFSAQLDALVGAGLVAQERSGRVRPSTWLSLTDRGRATLLAHAAALRSIRDARAA